MCTYVPVSEVEFTFSKRTALIKDIKKSASELIELARNTNRILNSIQIDYSVLADQIASRAQVLAILLYKPAGVLVHGDSISVEALERIVAVEVLLITAMKVISKHQIHSGRMSTSEYLGG